MDNYCGIKIAPRLFKSLFKFLVEDGQYEQAAILAEKYHDFHSLIQICELTDNMERLDHYCDKFSSVVRKQTITCSH